MSPPNGSDQPGPGNGVVESEAKFRLLRLAAQHALDYVAAERQGRVFPSESSIAALDELSSLSLQSPMPPERVLDILARCGQQSAVRSTGGRYFGFVTGGTQPTALAASVLSLAWDQNAALPAMSPLAATVDRLASAWVVELLGLPTGSVASFCGGASVANLVAVTAARDALLANVGWSVARAGLNNAPPVTVVTSTEAHVSATKALRIAGWGTDQVVEVPTDSLGRLRVDLIPVVEPPVLFMAQMGNVNTGHSDPLAELADLRQDRYNPGQSWIHVDGAFGLWAAASTEHRDHAVGMDQADSWATDAHKWLNTPYDCGVVIARNGHDLRRAMSAAAAYLPGTGDQSGDETWTDDLRQPMHLGLQMSQAARAIPVFAELASLGVDGIAELVDRSCRLAGLMASKLEAAGAEILAPPGLNQVLISFGSDAATDDVVQRVQRDGTCWAGATTWQGRRAMRFSVSDASTTQADIDLAADAVIACWRQSCG